MNFNIMTENNLKKYIKFNIRKKTKKNENLFMIKAFSLNFK